MGKLFLYISLFICFLTSWAQGKSAGWSINTDPIYILDGNEISVIGLKKIDPNNIATVNVIKSEKAKTIYGDRGVNGVLVMKSKEPTPAFYKIYAMNFTSNVNEKILTLSGKIIDCENVPLRSITIVNLNTNEKFINQDDGSFQLKCHKNDVLSFKGANTEEVRILAEKNKSKLRITLKEKDTTLVKPVPEGTIMIKKPVIYLYPEQKTDVSIKVDFKGNLLTTFPKYQNGWQVTAYPDGRIYDQLSKRFYTSLFWDGKRNFEIEHGTATGFIVEKEQLTSFLIEKLEKIGLNTNETNDFIQFWLPVLEENQYNFIRFKINEACNSISTNEVIPAPETTIRVMMEFYKTEKNTKVIEQQLTTTKRKGFTLVEWGGAEIPRIHTQTNL